jgi:hypothetical protein
MTCARQHLRQQGEIQLAVRVIKLAGRANQQLSGGARLDVKRHRGAAAWALAPYPSSTSWWLSNGP